MKNFFYIIRFIIPAFIIIYFFTCINNTKSINTVDSSTMDILQNGQFISDVGTFTSDNSHLNEPINNFIKEYLSTRNSATLTGNVDNLCGYFNKSSDLSDHALIYDFKRIAYLKDWSNERGIKFTNIDTKENILNIISKDNYTFVTFEEESTFTYTYSNSNLSNTFTIALTHNMKLDDRKDKYTIIKDYYQDGFKNALDDYKFNGSESTIPIRSNFKYNIDFATQRSNSIKSVDYADKYYNTPNPIYPISMNFQGNSANFVSQCLGDAEEGLALPQDNDWNPFKEAWMDNTFFKEYFLSSDRGRIICSGDFATLYPEINNIRLGDIVSYSKGNLVVFTALVTGFDDRGYPLVNSNSVTRYKVPFDLGWSNKNIKISFIHTEKK